MHLEFPNLCSLKAKGVAYAGIHVHGKQIWIVANPLSFTTVSAVLR